ncbi:MAG: glycoside hydrolase family 9 protein, partial [Huintestinicola sp.]
AGYRPDSVKKAVMPFPAESFEIVGIDGSVRAAGSTVYAGTDKNSGDVLYTADFSDFSEKGTFRIRAGNLTSEPFEIGESVYEKALDCTSKAFYYLRCGCGLLEKYAGRFRHGVCHRSRGLLWENRDISMEVSGGWHDAGDYGRYVTPGACALAHLLYGYILFPDAFDRQKLNIPESGGILPDILAECRYEFDWLLKMQRDDGAVYHKVTSAHHAPFIMPEEDRSQMFVFPVSSSATADLAAVCALGSRVYRQFDKDYAARLLDAAQRAFEWLEKNPGFLGFNNPPGCATGVYGESCDDDNRFWAAAELFAASGDNKFLNSVRESLKKDFSLTDFGCYSVGGLGALSYMLSAGGDSDILKLFEDAFLNEANRLKAISDSCGYGAAMDEFEYGWGSNMNLLKHGMIFAIADRCFGKREFRRYAQAQADVLFGVNALGISYVTGIGGHCCKYPHLRTAYADGVEECIPGMVCGGPNRNLDDPEAKCIFKPGTPPMKCFADNVACYSLNEVAIYWNSPAVFLLAYLCL